MNKLFWITLILGTILGLITLFGTMPESDLIIALMISSVAIVGCLNIIALCGVLVGDLNKQRAITPKQVLSDDPLEQEAAARAWNSGKMIFGRRKEDGSIEWEETPLDNK